MARRVETFHIRASHQHHLGLLSPSKRQNIAQKLTQHRRVGQTHLNFHRSERDWSSGKVATLEEEEEEEEEEWEHDDDEEIWGEEEHDLFSNDIIPNSILDSMDPEGSIDRISELFRDGKFWFDLLIWFILIDFLSAIASDPSLDMYT